MHLLPRERWVIAALTLILGACGACDPADQPPRRWHITPTPEIEIGVVAGEEVYLFQSIESARFLPDGSIAVADAGLREVRIYGPAGEFRTRMGGRGEGPGEFQDIGGLWLTSDGAIAVWDAANRRITVFGPDGRLRDTNRVPGNGGAAGNVEVFLGAFDNDDIVLAALYAGGGDRTREPVADHWVLGRFGLDGELRAKLGDLRGMRRVARNVLAFTPMPHVALYRDSLYVVDGYEPRITVRDGSGATARTIDLPRAAEASADAAWASLETALRQRQGPFPQLLLAQLEHGLVPRQDRFPQVAGLLAGDRGYIWVKTYDPDVDSVWLKANPLLPAPGGEWRIVRPDGGVVATVRVPENVTPLEIEGGRLLGVASDSLGVQRIVVHAIRR